MTYKTLTDFMIRQSFEKIGVDQSYFPIYETEAKRCYSALEKDCPNEDDNAESSLALTDDYIKYYIEESEKGHCSKWCASVAKNSVTGDDEYYIYREAYNCLDSVEDKERELNIHTNSLSEDPIFRERYKSMFEEGIANLKESTENYTRIFHSLIDKGRSEVYAHAYASVSEDYKPFFCEIYAEAYELGIKHGMDDSEAYCFGDTCTEALDQGLWVEKDRFLERYHEDWQKEFYGELFQIEYEYEHGKKMPKHELELVKAEI